MPEEPSGLPRIHSEVEKSFDHLMSWLIEKPARQDN